MVTAKLVFGTGSSTYRSGRATSLNVTIAGASLLLMRTGAVGLSLDGLRESRIVGRPPVGLAT